MFQSVSLLSSSTFWVMNKKIVWRTFKYAESYLSIMFLSKKENKYKEILKILKCFTTALYKWRFHRYKCFCFSCRLPIHFCDKVLLYVLGCRLKKREKNFFTYFDASKLLQLLVRLDLCFFPATLKNNSKDTETKGLGIYNEF